MESRRDTAEQHPSGSSGGSSFSSSGPPGSELGAQKSLKRIKAEAISNDGGQTPLALRTTFSYNTPLSMQFYGHRRIAGATPLSAPSLSSSTCQTGGLNSPPYASSLSLSQSAGTPTTSPPPTGHHLSPPTTSPSRSILTPAGIKTERTYGLTSSSSTAPASRKFVPNLGTLHRAQTTSPLRELGGDDKKGNKEEGVKKEVIGGDGHKKSNLNAFLLRSLDHTVLKGVTNAGRDGRSPPFNRPFPGMYPGGVGSQGSSPTPGGGTPGLGGGSHMMRRPLLHMVSPAAIRESNLRLMQQQKLAKDGRKKSRKLMEISWIGCGGGDDDPDNKDDNSSNLGGAYTPVSLPFVVREDDDVDEDETQGHGRKREPPGGPCGGHSGSIGERRPDRRTSRRPTARHVEESNRFAAGLLLVNDDQDAKKDGKFTDTWELAEDEQSGKGTDFLHICLPFLFPPMDRQAMEEARQARASRANAGEGDEKERSDKAKHTSDCNSSSSADKKRGGGKDETKENAAGAAGGAKKGIGANRGSREPPAAPLGPSPALPLPSLPEGRIGKLLVHRSGRVELRLLCQKKKETAASGDDTENGGGEREKNLEERTTGDSKDDVVMGEDCNGKTKEKRTTKTTPRDDEDAGICFEVNVGSECTFAQEVGCLVEDTSEFVFLGRCSKRMVIAPDIRRCLRSVASA